MSFQWTIVLSYMGYKVPYKEPIFTHLFWVMNDQTFFLACGIDKNEMGKTEESKALQKRNLLKIQSIASPSFFIWLQLICSSKCQWSHSVLISSSVTYLQPQSFLHTFPSVFSEFFYYNFMFTFSFLEHLWLWKTVATGHSCVVSISALHISVIWRHTSSTEQSMEAIYNSVWRESA